MTYHERIEAFRHTAPMVSDEDLQEAARLWTLEYGRILAGPVIEIIGEVLDKRHGIDP